MLRFVVYWFGFITRFGLFKYLVLIVKHLHLSANLFGVFGLKGFFVLLVFAEVFSYFVKCWVSLQHSTMLLIATAFCSLAIDFGRCIWFGAPNYLAYCWKNWCICISYWVALVGLSCFCPLEHMIWWNLFDDFVLPSKKNSDMIVDCGVTSATYLAQSFVILIYAGSICSSLCWFPSTMLHVLGFKIDAYLEAVKVLILESFFYCSLVGYLDTG